MQKTDFLVGFIIGGLIGAAATILYTPASGRSLRDRAQGYVQNLRQEMREANLHRRIELEQELDSLREPKTSPTD